MAFPNKPDIALLITSSAVFGLRRAALIPDISGYHQMAADTKNEDFYSGKDLDDLGTFANKYHKSKETAAKRRARSQRADLRFLNRIITVAQASAVHRAQEKALRSLCISAFHVAWRQ